MKPNKIQTVAVYCSASVKIDPLYLDAAREVGEELARRQLTMIYGGSTRSMMGAAAEAVMTHGGRVIGFIPKHLKKIEVPKDDITELHLVDTSHIRKHLMFEHSDAFFILPGGFGTLDETFEIIARKDLKLHEKPIIFINVNGYWDALSVMVKNIFDQNFARSEDKDLFQIVSSVSEAFQVLLGEKND